MNKKHLTQNRSSVVKIFSGLIVFSIAILSVSCSSADTDVTAPEIEELGFVPSPTPDSICGTVEQVVFNLESGDDFELDLIFRDDEMLSQYKIDIHNNFDCHGHGGGIAPAVVVPSVENQTIDWTILEIEELTNQEQNVTRVLKVPENVTAGNYHFHIQAIDESGNDSPFENFYSLKIENQLDKVAPAITVSAPVNRSFAAQKGETIRFSGTVTDNRSLSDGGNGILYLAYTDLSSGNTFSTNMAFPFDENVSTSFNFDFEYTVPQTLITGDYRFSLGANDGVRNVGQFQFFDVNVTN